MKKSTLVLMVAVLAIASACSKEKKITKSLWKGEGTWNVTTSSYAFYSMGTYNTSTSSYEDSLTVSSGSYTGSTFVFEKVDNASQEGKGTFTTTDTTVNFTYFVSEDVDFNTGKTTGEYVLTLENDPPAGGTSEQEFYDIVSHDDTKMSLERVNNSGWSTTPYDVMHSYITIEMEKK
ncbi:MAG: hypothetical protein HYZ14_04040 [Bacteroidetes bacterium]|nr:hypothetical protein [Bacteroidota bacterium]